MWTITKSFKISYAHRVFTQDLGESGFIPKCVNLHGHDSKVIYSMSANKLNKDTLMVLDYTLLKPQLFKKYNLLHGEHLDHTLILSTQDDFFTHFIRVIYNLDERDIKAKVQQNKYYYNKRLGLVVVDFVPTAETLAYFLFQQFKRFLSNLQKDNYKITFITGISVWFNETEGSTCQYTEEDLDFK